jgi:hypothetical protein
LSEELKFDVVGCTGQPDIVLHVRYNGRELPLRMRERWVLWYLWENDVISLMQVAGTPQVGRVIMSRLRRVLREQRVPFIIRSEHGSQQYVLQPKLADAPCEEQAL